MFRLPTGRLIANANLGGPVLCLFHPKCSRDFQTTVRLRIMFPPPGGSSAKRHSFYKTCKPKKYLSFLKCKETTHIYNEGSGTIFLGPAGSQISPALPRKIVPERLIINVCKRKKSRPRIFFYWRNVRQI